MSNTKSTKTEYITRPPIVTIMGHVDHGKTSILDYYRKSNVVSKEYGGITQRIGAYQISYKDKKITFIDTPGHQAFSQMRARGGKAADIVVLVVSAEEGVKPQTKEAIKHARAANVPIIVAINKVDLPNANPQKIKQELAQENILTEDWGGDVLAVEVSAKTGKGLDLLLESILTVAEFSNLRASTSGELEAVIIESKLDTKKGVVVSAIVKNGCLKTGDKIVASGKGTNVRSLMGADGINMKEALPSDPVEILGFREVPNVGDLILYQGSELAELAGESNKVEIIGKNTKKTVAIVLKADTQGTLEAVKAALAEIVTSNVSSTYSLKFLLSGTGDITDSDVMLANSAKGLVVGFDVKVPGFVSDLAEDQGTPIKVYKTIYELVDNLKEVLEGTATKEELKIKGRAKILKVFKLPSGDLVLGSKVVAGAIKDTSRVSVYAKDPSEVTKDEIPLYTGNVKSLKNGKNDVSVVGKDVECGVLLKPQFEAVEGMWIEVR